MKRPVFPRHLSRFSDVLTLFGVVVLLATGGTHLYGQTETAKPNGSHGATQTEPQDPAQAVKTPIGVQEAAAGGAKEGAKTSEWIQLFNGKDLSGWTAKIRGHALGDNYADTFRVVDGLLTVSYDKYVDADFKSMDGKNRASWEKFGHLFFNKSFSHYVLRAEYRFVGEQVKNGPGWAYRNNGFMLHGQDPATMAKDQKFPVSIEVQLLGGNGKDKRSTLNLCTPGTNVVIDNKLFRPHCTSSNSETYHGDQWVTVEIEVRGNQVVRHKIDGKTVLEYNAPQLDPRDGEAKLIINGRKDGNLMLKKGTISIQSESHPTQFRKIELKEIK